MVVVSHFQNEDLIYCNDFISYDNSFTGKSTCISLLLCYYETTLGQIMINGRSITDYQLKQFRQNIGVVSQEPVCLLLFFFFSFCSL